jgi:capsular polysaccharide biosynthesis protein
MRLLNSPKRFARAAYDSLLSNVPSKWLSSPEYALKFNAIWHRVYAAMPNTRTSPTYYGSLKIDLQSRLDSEFPEAGVLELNGALLLGRVGWVFSQEGYLLPDHSWYCRHVNEMKVPKVLPRGRYLKGVCLSLASDHSIKSYGHFLMDCLSRLELFYQAGFKLTDVDYIFCPKPFGKTAERLFAQLNVPAGKCIWADRNLSVSVETLLTPTFPGTRRNYPKWVPAFLQRTFLSSLPAQRHRRLYISRSGFKRNVVNEEAIKSILLRHNFEIYDPLQHINQPSDFAEAEIVVGPMGAGLSNLAFCHPGTKVLELIPSDHDYPYFYTISEAAGLKYSCLMGRSTNHRDPSAFGPSPYDFHVDEHEFDHAIAQITGASIFN